MYVFILEISTVSSPLHMSPKRTSISTLGKMTEKKKKRELQTNIKQWHQRFTDKMGDIIPSPLIRPTDLSRLKCCFTV